MSRDPYWGAGHAGGGCGDGCLDVGVFWTFPFSVDPVAGVAGYVWGTRIDFDHGVLVSLLQSTRFNLHSGNTMLTVENPYRVKTGYVTNKVIGVDGGLFAQ